MSVPPQVMAGMKPGAAAPGAPAPGAAPPSRVPGPGASPMSTPQKPGGMIEGAKVQALLAVKILERTIPTFGSDTPEGKAVMKAITGLAKTFGKHEDETKELMPAEIKKLLQGLAGPGAPPKPPAGGAPQPTPAAPPPGAPPMVG